MCGRFPQAQQYQQFRRSVSRQLPDRQRPRGTRNADNYRASYNVAPNSNVAVVRRAIDPQEVERLTKEDVPADADADDDGDAGNDEENNGQAVEAGDRPLLIQSMRWGFLPHYQKTTPEYKDTLNTINARADVLLSGSPMWSRPFNKGQRCVVFTQGFYEWQKTSSGKMPHFIGMDKDGEGREAKDGESKALMPLAGLWEKCQIQGEEEPRYTFTIMTTDVSKQLSFLHDRQPFILDSPEAIEMWLDTTAPLDQVRKLIQVYEGPLEFYKVPKEVGKVGNDDAAFIMPVAQRKDGLMAAFGRAAKKEEGHETQEVKDGSTEKQAKKEENHGAESKQEVGSAHPPSSDTNTETNAPEPTSKELKEETDGDVEARETTKPSTPSTPKQSQATTQPSSRWSPDPFNPPVSPERPNGGYSTVEDPHGGLTKYGKASHDWTSGGSPGASYKRKAAASSPPPKVKMGDGMLEGAFKKQKVKQEVEEASKEFEDQVIEEVKEKSAEESNEDPGSGSKEDETTAADGHRSSPRAAGGKGHSRGSSNNGSAAAHTKSPKSPRGARDIRSFFDGGSKSP